MSAPPSPSTSPTLLELLRTPENDSAWERFVELYLPLIDRWASKHALQSADVEEIRSTVFVKLVSALKSFQYDPARRFRGYLKTVVETSVIDLWQKRRNVEVQATPGQLQGLLQPESIQELSEAFDSRMHHDLGELQRVIDRARGQVSESNWRAFWLTAVEKRPVSEVAKELGKTFAAVYQAKSRVARHLRQLAEEMKH